MTINFNSYFDPFYCYKAKVVSVYDGDTITCEIDVGFGIILAKQKIRLFGIDTPEIRGEERPEGLIIRDKLREMIDGQEILIYTIKDKKGKYGRWLGIIIKNDININELLLQEKGVKECIY